jgi:glycosyltransferase involved in cell wall biosynthesis
MKKILINMPTIGKDGIMIIWLLKFKKLQAEGWQLYLHGGTFIKKIKIDDPYTFNQRFKEIKNKGMSRFTKFNFIVYSIKANFQSLKNYRKIVRQNYDIIYSPSSVLDLTLLPWLIKTFNKKTRWVTIFDNVVPFTDPGNKIIRFLAWVFYRMSLRMIRKADLICASTSELMEFLLSSGFKKDRLVETNFAIENDLIKKAKADNKYNIDALFIGRINETKGIYDMLKIVANLKKTYPKFQFALMGNGDEVTMAAYKKKIAEMKLIENVQFLGFRTGLEKFGIIKAAKCFWFLSVSDHESFGMALLESVCCGKPAFVYDLAPFRRLYQNGEVMVFKKGDYKAVTKKVLELFKNKQFDNKKGKLLVGKYSWDNIALTESKAMGKLFLANE